MAVSTPFKVSAGKIAGKNTNASASHGLRTLDGKAIAETGNIIEKLSKKYHGKFSVTSKVNVGVMEVNVQSEDYPLHSVIMSMPTYLDWEVPINSMEAANDNNRPDRALAVEQHGKFVEKLLNLGIEVIMIEPSKEMLEGVYTRDIGFVIGGKFFMANMAMESRKEEEHVIGGGIKPPSEVIVEGGNIIVQSSIVFVGVGDRTNYEAVEWLKAELNNSKEVIPLKLKKGTLHLDCVLLPFGKNAIIDESAFVDSKDVEQIKKIYSGKKKNLKATGANLLALNSPCVKENTRIVNGQAKNVIKMLEQLGEKVITVNLSEIIKAEGGPRCSVLPLVQKK